ncbi:tripartite tricarboxylate transporter substrate binding protein [Bordetella bronchiseptica]|uniref:tripartite tricarboxylate transporter substrate binding protein n=1 Tax=Bordetella bronchiseptica TaxID=518 RepID=UPI000459703D|nr:tripartite tricarboxylate transporter substrate binding protein [Bordetella bronchiseptica]KAK67746.1 tripartite tricarboxylate transporter family receptor [Bordetella bronchiseptica MO211]
MKPMPVHRAGAAGPDAARRSLLAAIPGLMLGAVARAQPAAYPAHRVTLLVPYTAGTAADAVARFIAAKLTALWGTTVLVENKAGADGVVGTRAVLQAPADGHMVLFTGPPFLYNTEMLQTAPYVPLRDFQPVARVSSAMWLFAAGRQAPFANLAELIALDKRQGRAADIAVSGSAAMAVATALKNATGARLNIVPYTSTSQAITDAAAGHVDAVAAAIAGVAPLVRSGMLNALGVSGPTRSLAVPEIPTLAEAGAPGFGFVSWNAAFVRSGTPEAAIARLAEGMGAVAASAEFREFAREQGVEPAFMGPDAWPAEAADQQARWSGLLREAGLIKPKQG